MLSWTAIEAHAATIDPVLKLKPTAARAGSSVTVWGMGWDAHRGDVSIFASEQDSLNPDSTPLQTAPINLGGSFSTTWTVPGDLLPKSYVFYACQDCGEPDRSLSATRGFEILPPPDPTLTLDPGTGAHDDVVQISGKGWSPDLGEVFVLTDQSAPAAIASAVPDNTGGFGPVDWTVTDDLAAASYEFYACQACDDTELILQDTAPFTVTEVPVRAAELLLDPRSGAPGDTVTVSGTGWSPEAGRVSIFSDNTQSGDQANALKITIPDDNGVLDDTFKLPELDEANYQFYACQACSDLRAVVSDEAAFTVNGGSNPTNNGGSNGGGPTGGGPTGGGPNGSGSNQSDSDGSDQSHSDGSHVSTKSAPDLPDDGDPNPPIALIVGGIALLLLTAAAAATACHHRRAAVMRRRYLKPRPDPTFEIQRSPVDGPSLPRVHLIPHYDQAATAKIIEVTP